MKEKISKQLLKIWRDFSNQFPSLTKRTLLILFALFHAECP